MPYVKPGTNISSIGPAGSSDSDYLVVDGVSIPFGTAMQASAAGFGIIDPNTGTFEVLDALPLNYASVQTAIESASNISFATIDRLTTAEVTASGGRIKGGFAFAAATPTLTVTVTPATVVEGNAAVFSIVGGAAHANQAITLTWSGTFNATVGLAGPVELTLAGVAYSDGQFVTLGALSTTLTLDAGGNGTVTITPNLDGTVEGAETLTLTVSFPGSTGDSATLTIND